jgi:uncharacterized membrane protein YhaH (DUF805 family)
MSFMQAITSAFQNYVNFNGRAQRSAFWYFVLLVFGIGIVINILETIVGGPMSSMYGIVAGLGALIDLAILLPYLGLGVRRLHDTNRSGWWLLIWFTIIGIIFLIIWFAQKGTTGENRFGPDPLGGSEPTTPAATFAS